jgi:hypothetical protein
MGDLPNNSDRRYIRPERYRTVNYDFMIDMRMSGYNPRKTKEEGIENLEKAAAIYFSDPKHNSEEEKRRFRMTMDRYKRELFELLKIEDRALEHIEVLKGMTKGTPEYNAQKDKVRGELSNLLSDSGHSVFGQYVGRQEWVDSLEWDVKQDIGIYRPPTIQSMPQIPSAPMMANWPREEEKKEKKFGYQLATGSIPPPPPPGSGSGSGSGFRYQLATGSIPPPPPPGSGSGSGSGFEYHPMIGSLLPPPGSGSGSGRHRHMFPRPNSAKIVGGRTRRSRKHTRKSKGKKASRGRR